MVGNDIVDLTLAGKESDWRRKGFLDKVFTSIEQNYIFSFTMPDLMVWLIWSMKESAYKIFVQENFRRILAPLKFQCSLLSRADKNFLGEVYIDKKIYKTFSKIYTDKVSTAAFSGKPSLGIFLSNDIQFTSKDYIFRQKELITDLFRGISEKTGKHAEDFSIKKDRFNIPNLFYRDKYFPGSISFSRHGRYGAYAAELH